MVELVSEEATVYSIQVNDEEVGYIEITRDATIVQIEILPEHRRNGYGTEAINKYIQLKKEQGYDTIRTTAVINPTFQNILLSIGFEPTEDEMKNSFIYRFE